MRFGGWAVAAKFIEDTAKKEAGKRRGQKLDSGQCASLKWIARRIQKCGVVLADEVGTGKTRIACAVAQAIIEAGGRVAIVVPPGLMHQWDKEWREIGGPSRSNPGAERLKALTNLTDLFSGWRKAGKYAQPMPRRGSAEAWLISHAFRAPVVRSNGDPWRASLPSLVREAVRKGPGPRRLQSSLKNGCKNLHGEGFDRIARAVASVVRRNNTLRNEIESLPLFNCERDKHAELLSCFGAQEQGRYVVEKILGLWLGDFDLIVVDEAHKGRSDDAPEVPPATILSRLLEHMLRQPATGRRLCMTATPMELELEQWQDLLKRAKCDCDPERTGQVLQRLRRAAESAAVAPDEPARLEELEKAACEFQRTLSPFVTRRRRDEEDSIQKFRQAAGSSAGTAHPHRNVDSVAVTWPSGNGTPAKWSDILFAGECLSRSLRGLTQDGAGEVPRPLVDAYTKLAACYVSDELTDETSGRIRVHPKASEHVRGKIRRANYWSKRLSDARSKLLAGSETADCDHPRILAAVHEIEKCTQKGEKVLVFGVFLKPLRLLRDVLNVRHAILNAAAGRPITHAIYDGQLRPFTERQLKVLEAEAKLDEKLSILSLRKSHNSYRRLRRQVLEKANESLKAFWAGYGNVLDGSASWEQTAENIREHMITFMVDQLLNKGQRHTRAVLDSVAQQFLDQRLHPLLQDSLDQEAGEGDEPATPEQALREVFCDEENDGQQSYFASLLQGSTRWHTRRYLQNAFNTVGAAPMVLLAQSQVGREGLNLHQACRFVIQFHAEWSPAVLEQQIGRVDRKGSRWEKKAQTWLEGPKSSNAPRIEVRRLVLDGTYDEYQWDRVLRRQQSFNASLFGALLPEEALDRVPPDWRDRLIAAAPQFSPMRKRKKGRPAS